MEKHNIGWTYWHHKMPEHGAWMNFKYPKGYVALDYVRPHGSCGQWVETGYRPSSTDRIEMEVTKARLFAHGCDRAAIDVSPLDWFPAFALWTFHLNHPLWSILGERSRTIDREKMPEVAEHPGNARLEKAGA